MLDRKKFSLGALNLASLLRVLNYIGLDLILGDKEMKKYVSLKTVLSFAFFVFYSLPLFAQNLVTGATYKCQFSISTYEYGGWRKTPAQKTFNIAVSGGLATEKISIGDENFELTASLIWSEDESNSVSVTSWFQATRTRYADSEKNTGLSFKKIPNSDQVFVDYVQTFFSGESNETNDIQNLKFPNSFRQRLDFKNNLEINAIDTMAELSCNIL